MKRVDLQFLLLGAASLVVGVSLGILMGIQHDFMLMPVHAHINLVGWVSLMLFGLVYRAYPELGRRRLAKLHLLLAATAAVLLPPGIAMVLLYQSQPLAITASFLWLGACVIFLLQLLSLFSAKEASESPFPAE